MVSSASSMGALSESLLLISRMAYTSSHNTTILAWIVVISALGGRLSENTKIGSIKAFMDCVNLLLSLLGHPISIQSSL